MFSPFMFVSIALPGQGTQMIQWYLKRVYGTVALFVFTYASFIFAMLLSQGGIISLDAGSAGYVPPLFGFIGSGRR